MEKILPYVEAPEGLTRGVLIESNMGRPTKVEGNPLHPASLGATDAQTQGAVLEFWDPDRSQTVYQGGITSTRSALRAALDEAMAKTGKQNGGGLRIITGSAALTLKLLTCSLSGAVVAAPTTSLPEGPTGDRNWDYRYCWLRDTSLVLQSFVDLGYVQDAQAFLAWLLHATRLTQPRLQVMYDVFGETALTERALDQFEGYRGIGPVRVGNAAHSQLQLDIYGDVILTAYGYVKRGGSLDRYEKNLLTGFLAWSKS